MANSIFAFPDYTIPDSHGGTGLTVLSGGSWSAPYLLTNLQDATGKRMSTIARSTNDDAASTIIKGNFVIDRYIKVFAICRHNLSSAATVRIRLYANANWTGTTTDSTTLNAWKSHFPPGADLWGEPDKESTIVGVEALAGYKYDYFYVFSSPITCKSYQVDIVDTTNPDGYIELSRCILAPGWIPPINLSFGAGIQWEDTSIISQSIGGAEWVERRSKRRVLTGVLDNMTEEGGSGAFFEMQRRLGKTDELYFVFDPDDVYQTERARSFLCTMSELSPLQFPYANGATGGFTLREVL